MNNSNLHVLNLSAYEAPEVVETKKDEWVTYGKNNDYYSFLIDRYKNSATNNAIINNICKFVFGKGLSATDASKKPNEYAQLVTLLDPEELKKVILDYKMLGQGAFQIHYSKNHKKIAKVYHMPIHLLAPEKCDKDGNINGYFYSDNWEDIKKYPPKRIPAFGSSQSEVEILCFKNYTVGMKYFGCVDYVGSLAYCTLEEEISDYLINEVQNGFSGTKVVNFNNGIPTEEQQTIISNKVMGKLTGSHGQKVIVAFNSDETSKTTIDDIQLNDAPDHYSYLSEECMRKIMLGHNVTSPLLFGIANANGFSSNADELENSSILFENMVIKPIQGVIINAIDKILAFNKISLKLYFKTLQPLQFKDLEGYEVEEEKETSYSFAKEQNHVVNLLTALGEEVPEDWLLISESEVDYDNEDQLDEIIAKANFKQPEKSILSKIVDLVSQGRAYPKAKSEQDIEVGDAKFYTRYRYAGETNEKSRDFCQQMIERNLMYRKEDIQRMKNSAVNKGWGPKGAATYDIWLYKGGGSCRHRWNREVYVQFGSKEIDITDPKVRNTAQRKLKRYGYDPKKGVLKNPAKVSQRPRDMKNRGFLKPKNFTTPL
ncbi:MAG: putative portal protein [Prokaryotic dsDNA virus sp.]|nr:MAG: putative portal protein [Prokaryotic dsDNA virus sp.]|tara:strand:- start:5437 stop:7233 length:1797 start_codon:yes stop_codon:yes gene_type:complete